MYEASSLEVSESDWYFYMLIETGQTLLDLTIVVPPNMTVRASHAVELRVRERVMSTRREVREVKIHVHGQENGEAVMIVNDQPKEIKTDFGREGC